jgi:transcriptional regulator of arginine metabolism
MSAVNARRAQAIELIKSGKIASQSDLVKELKKSGFTVTQATASRDLEEIGAVRGRSGYTITGSEEGSITRSMPLPADLILSVEASGNLAVVRTPPGGAQLLASSLDHSGIRSIIGTIAGDDTVLVVSRKASGGAELAKELLSYRGGRVSSRTAKKVSR